MPIEIKQIEALLNEAVEAIKSDLSKHRHKRGLPDYHEYYAETVKDAKRIGVHIDKDIVPEELFSVSAPNEKKEELEYRKAAYKAVTVPSMHRAINSTYRIFNPNNWSEEYPETPSLYSEATIKDYFTKDYPSFDSLIAYFKQVYVTSKIWHSNGVAVCYPLPTPDKVNNEGEIIKDTTTIPEPVVKIFDTERAIYYKENEYFFGLTDEKSLIKDGNSFKKEGLVFEFYDDTYIYKIIQVGKRVDWKFEIQVYWQHDLGYVPCGKLKGIVKEVTEYGKIYESHFGAAIPLLEEALMDASTLQLVKIRQAYPTRWDISDPCNHPDCIDGRVWVKKDGETPYEDNCPKCLGSGKAMRFSPSSDIQIKMPDRLNANDLNFPMPPAGYIAPPSEIMKFLREEITSNIIKAWAALNIDVSNSDVKGSDTALKSQIDREELFSFLMQFSSEVFEAYHFFVETIGRMRYRDKWPTGEYKLHPPRTFDIRTENERIEEIARARKDGLSPVVIREMEGQFIDTRFNGNTAISDEMTLAGQVDRLFSISDIDIQSKIANRTVERWEAILHDSISTFIQEAVIEDPDFMTKDYAYKKDYLVNKAKEKADEMEEGTNVDNILANADAE